MQSLTSQFREVLLPDSPFWGKCARHQNASTANDVARLFLCDRCGLRLTRECFNDRPPIYHGELSRGYCGLCNEFKDIAMRQWFIDPICLDAVFGYSKSIAASKLVHDTWKNQIKPILPGLQLQEINAVHIAPLLADTTASSQTPSSPHFSAIEVRKGKEEVLLFHIELNISQRSPTDISEFQLEVSDYLDIENVMRNTERPVYVFFVQVTEEHNFPTRRNVGQRLWWTDIFTLRDNLIGMRHPRGSSKHTAYFNPDVFKPIDSFIQHLVQQRYFDLKHSLATQGIPNLPKRMPLQSTRQ